MRFTNARGEWGLAHRFSIDANGFDDPKAAQGKKKAVHPPKRFRKDRPLMRGQVEVFGDLENYASGDAVQNAAGERWRANRIVLDPKEIAACGFNDFSVGVKHNCYVCVIRLRLSGCQ